MKTHLFFIKQKLLRPYSMQIYRTLMNNQTLSFEELNEINWQKRKLLLDHAYHTVPFYNEMFKNIGLNPEDIKTTDDWVKVPITTRRDLADSFQRMKSSHCTKANSALSPTGGSTGNPVKVLHDRRFPYETLGWRMLSWWNISPGFDAAYVRLLDRKKRIARISNSIMWWPTTRIWLDAASINHMQMDYFIRSFNKFKPALLQGYVGNIHHLALYIEENSIPIHSPDAVWVTSCPVSAVERSLIEHVFHAPVYDQYGCGEVYWLSAECKAKKGLHINHDARLIEFLNENGKTCMPGELGRIIVTDLENYVFPLIRYENGDMSRYLASACPCGVTLPLMDAVHGRIDDLIRLPNGTVLSGLTTLFDDFPEAIRAFQVVQKRDYSINIRVVSNPHHNQNEIIINKIKRKLDESVQGQAPINVDFVNEIKSDRGKLRFIISEVKVRGT
jgi:phenylacetate-CoA ligase